MSVENLNRARSVRKQNLKLRLLALVLALLLLWYSINPAPPVIVRRRRNEDEDQDAERRDAEHEITLSTLPARAYRTQAREPSTRLPSSSVDDEDDFEWPEFIDG
jgi:hypothetical protein